MTAACIHFWVLWLWTLEIQILTKYILLRCSFIWVQGPFSFIVNFRYAAIQAVYWTLEIQCRVNLRWKFLNRTGSSCLKRRLLYSPGLKAQALILSNSFVFQTHKRFDDKTVVGAFIVNKVVVVVNQVVAVIARKSCKCHRRCWRRETDNLKFCWLMPK